MTITEQVEIVAVVEATLRLPHATLEQLVGRPYDGSEQWRDEAETKAAEYAQECLSFSVEGDKDYDVAIEVETEIDTVTDPCVCTPEQRESGGFTSRCPVHG